MKKNRDGIVLALMVLMRTRVGKFIKCQATDWDKDVKTSARFNTFNGKRSDWEARFQFWRDLIIKVARHLG